MQFLAIMWVLYTMEGGEEDVDCCLSELIYVGGVGAPMGQAVDRQLLTPLPLILINFSQPDILDT